ncbi:MAG: sulfite exporter TauE/SafE family protein [Planctomycetaceae bacterium]|nr:sulfite exporter TauE/SafE family protein [Planctomycetaceae bacterium]
MSDWVWYLLLIPAGFLAGIVNTIAGGGSFLTLPALMFICGLEPKIANGTNRVAILLSSGSASATFYRNGSIDFKLVLRLCVPLLLGAPVGVLSAIHLPVEAFKPVFGALFLAMAALLAFKPKLLTDADRKPRSSPFVEFVLFFAIGIYIGFIQAGMGILLLLAMGIFHARDLVSANAAKNVIGFLVTALALSVFVIYRQVEWIPGLTLAIGNLAGGYVGARIAISKGQKLVFAFLMIVMVATGLKLLWPSATSERPGVLRPAAQGSELPPSQHGSRERQATQQNGHGDRACELTHDRSRPGWQPSGSLVQGVVVQYMIE